MRVVICWSHISGYMAACWRALAAREDIQLLVLAFADEGKETAFGASVMAGIPHRLLDPRERDDADLVASLVAAHRPDAVALAGWFHPPYRALADHPALRPARKLMGMDTPWRGAPRQRLARFRLGPFLRKMDVVMVAGERAWQYARILGVPEAKVRRGYYGCDAARFAVARTRRNDRGDWPRRFLFVARYVPVKGIDVLLDAYARYRAAVADPWDLTCCGKGPLGDAIRAAPGGVHDAGFVQPDDMPDVMADHGAFVLPSLYEPWGVAIAEAAAAGLPVLCTEACGASVELVRSYFNGITVASGDPAALSAALRWVHDHPQRLPEMGAHGAALAAAFSAECWAERWAEALRAPERAIRGATASG
jgi:glycosyltransferase involved in cell wall biosynthesis